MVTDLLATCARGNTRGIDTICCTIFSEDELIEIISSNEINIYRKRPFMKFLVSVYMDAHGDRVVKKSEYYEKNRYNKILHVKPPKRDKTPYEGQY